MWYFHSKSFSPTPGEEELTNPGIYGEALCRWLYEKYNARGEECSEPEPEDWGWFFIVESEGCRVLIGCANESDSRDRWRVFCERDGLVSKLRSRCGEEAKKVCRKIGTWLKAHRELEDLLWEEE